jgi:predicted CXXCH cytochrome family protein
MNKSTILFMFITFTSLTSKPIQNVECLACHDEVNPEKFRSKSHGGLFCTNCHSSITQLPHEEKVSPVECSKCHRHQAEDYKMSVHGIAKLKGIEHAASCNSCHGIAHEIVSPRNPESKVAKQNMLATCGKCHSADFMNQLNTRLPHRTSRMGLTPDQVK